MKVIDSSKVSSKTEKCGKRLKVKTIVEAYVHTQDKLLVDNDLVKEVKEKLGEELFDQLTNTTITFFALELLARTHNQKEFKQIIKECEVDTNASA